MIPIGRLHVITDEMLESRRSHLDAARLAAEGGADVVQYREKRPLTTRELVQVATSLRVALPRAVQLIVDDRPDVALAAGAEGVHLGRDDLEPQWARAILGAGRAIGGTANSVEEARAWFRRPIDYLGVGPVYGTTSKHNPAPPLGLEALARIAREAPVPVIAIGGITPERVAEVMAAGAYGIAVLSGVIHAVDPRAATAGFRAALDRAREREGSRPMSKAVTMNEDAR